ncbi:MAG TPA: Hcp family type VI secretion system effector [Scandinavium sp.]|jgi:type VI secretion system secreted protein Hcp
MAIPGNMWIYDDGGALIKGGCDVQNREYSIEFKGFHHNLSTPTDNLTGKPTGKRIHSPLMIVKEFDYSSPYLYKAVATGQQLKSAEFKFYKINDAGQEVEYFNITLDGVRIVSVSPSMATPGDNNNNHLEAVEFRYEKITWKHIDGNIIFADAWNERPTA